MKILFIFLVAGAISLTSCTKGPQVGGKPPEFFFSNPDVISLCKAISNKNMPEIDRLIESGVNINTIGAKNEMTPLFWSLGSKNKEAYKKLLENGADPNIEIKKLGSIIFFTATIPDVEYLQLAIRYGGNVNLVNQNGETPIFDAIMHGNRNAIDIFLNSDTDLNFQDFSGTTPMILAADLNYYDIVLTLLNNGANPFLKTKSGETIANPIESSYRIMLRNVPLFEDLLKVIKELKKRGMKLNLKEPRKYRDKWKDGEKI